MIKKVGKELKDKKKQVAKNGALFKMKRSGNNMQLKLREILGLLSFVIKQELV
jgi:hypothetical protein